MSYRLIILGVLAERPHYGYDLKQTIERQHYAEYIRLSGGGLYYHLRKLRDEGYVEEQTVEREGTYPDRHIYRITERGRTYLIELLRTTLDDVAGRRTYDPLDAAFSFAFLLPNAEVLARLQHQLDVVQGQLAALEITQRFHQQIAEHTAGKVSSSARSESFYAQLMIDHNVALLQHEVSWLQEAIHRIEKKDDEEQHKKPDVHSLETENALSEQGLTDAYVQFTQTHTLVIEALAAYQRQVELARQEYQRQTIARPARSLQQAQQAYQQRIEESKQEYEEALRRVQEEEGQG